MKTAAGSPKARPDFATAASWWVSTRLRCWSERGRRAFAILTGRKPSRPSSMCRRLRESSITTTSIRGDGSMGGSAWSSFRLIAILATCRWRRQKRWTTLTLEYAYDDWCTAQMARALGKMDDYQYFSKRAQNYRNIWDASVGYFRPKHRDGKWVEDFSPSQTKDFIEGTAWQYSFYVPHDMKGLIGLMGKDELVRRLNQGFEDSRPEFSRVVS